MISWYDVRSGKRDRLSNLTAKSLIKFRQIPGTEILEGKKINLPPQAN